MIYRFTTKTESLFLLIAKSFILLLLLLMVEKKEIVKNEDDLLKLDEDLLNCLIYYKDNKGSILSYYECIDLEFEL